jgi:site-specific DNA recombinase
MLSNPYYVGFVVPNEVQYKGRHEALIDQVMFDKVQQTLAANLCGEKQRKHRHYLTSTLYCGYCGNRMCFSRNKGHGGTYEYWVCLGRQKLRAPCNQKWLAEEAIEAEVIHYWERVTLSDEKIEKLRTDLDAYLGVIREYGAEEVTELRHRIGRLRGEEHELLTLRYQVSISRDLFKEEQARIAANIAIAEREITSYELADCNYEDLYSKAADLLRRFPAAYAKAPPTVRRQCNRAIFSRLYLQGPRVTGAVLTPLGAGLLEPASGRTHWGRVPGDDNYGEDPPNDGLENHLPSTMVFVDLGSRENSLVEVAGIEPASSSFAVGLLRAQPIAESRRWCRNRRTHHLPAG